MQVAKNVHINISEFTIGKVAVQSVGDFLHGISLLDLGLLVYLRFRLQQQTVFAAAA